MPTESELMQSAQHGNNSNLGKNLRLEMLFLAT